MEVPCIDGPPTARARRVQKLVDLMKVQAPQFPVDSSAVAEKILRALELVSPSSSLLPRLRFHRLPPTLFDYRYASPPLQVSEEKTSVHF